jgi:hypothetical protein
MTVKELIEFLSAQSGSTAVKTWSPGAADYKEVTGAVWSVDGVLFLQTNPEGDMVRARREAANILLRHPPCLTDAPMGDLVEDIANAIAR